MELKKMPKTGSRGSFPTEKGARKGLATSGLLYRSAIRTAFITMNVIKTVKLLILAT
jgi:hypothetical protein